MIGLEPDLEDIDERGKLCGHSKLQFIKEPKRIQYGTCPMCVDKGLDRYMI